MFTADVMRSMYSFRLFVIIKRIYIHVNKVSKMNYLFKLQPVCIYFTVHTVYCEEGILY